MPGKVRALRSGGGDPTYLVEWSEQDHEKVSYVVYRKTVEGWFLLWCLRCGDNACECVRAVRAYREAKATGGDAA